MKILVVSDTHRKLRNLKDLLKRYEDLDLVIHLGDHIEDAHNVAKTTEVPFAAVAGNMDSAGSLNEVVETPGGKIFLAHGHQYGVRYNLSNLMYAAEEVGAKVALLGHTHVMYLEKTDDMLIMNPGSLEESRGMEPNSYGIINISEGSISCRVMTFAKDKILGTARLNIDE